MTKHVISMLTLLVVSLIAAMTLLFDTRAAGRLTPFGYAVAVLTVMSFVLGIAAELHTMRENARQEAEASAKHLEQRQQLERIETEMQASTRPLLPVAMFYTLRHTTTSEAVEREFGGARGFKGVKPGVLELVGTARLGGPLGYNSVKMTALESHCVLDGADLDARIKAHSGMGDSAIRQPVSCRIDFFLSKAGEIPSEPSLALERMFTTGSPDDVKRLELFDNTVFQDTFVRQWTAPTQAGQGWSVADLPSSRLRVQLRFLGEHGPVALHNLQLFFGPLSAMHGIHFPVEILSSAVFKPDDSPLLTPNNELAKRFFAPYILEFDCVLSDAILAEHFMRVLSG